MQQNINQIFSSKNNNNKPKFPFLVRTHQPKHELGWNPDCVSHQPINPKKKKDGGSELLLPLKRDLIILYRGRTSSSDWCDNNL